MPKINVRIPEPKEEYDFSNPDTKQFIIGCNSWHDIP